MLGRLLKLTFRNLRRNPLYASIVIGGLALGIMTMLAITQWTVWHAGFDRHFTDGENIFRISLIEKGENFERNTARIIHGDVVQQLYTSSEIPEIQKVGRLAPYRNAIVRNGDILFYEDKCFSCDPEFIEIFSPGMISGNPKTALSGPNRAIISEKAARKYFGEADPMGKVIEIVHQFDYRPQLFEITGIFRDFPENSHFRIDLLTSFSNPETYNSTAWVYLKLQRGASTSKIERQVMDLILSHNDEVDYQNVQPSLISLHNIHLGSNLARELERNINRQTLLILFIAGILVFLLSWFNFTLLSVSQSQLNMNKLIYQWQLGADRKLFFKQFFTEYLAIGTIAFLIGSILGVLVNMQIKSMLGVSLNQNREVLLISLLSIFLVLVVSSAVTSIYTTQRLYMFLQRKYLQRQRSDRRPVHSRNWFIRSVIIAEFVITFGLITNLLMIREQVEFSIRNQIGSNVSSTIQIPDLPRPVVDNYILFRNELKKYDVILEVTGMMEEPGGMAMDAFNYSIEGLPENENKLYVFPVDENFIRFYNLNILAGQDFPDYYDPNDTTEFYMLNETAARLFGLNDYEEIVGRELRLDFPYKGYFYPGKIVGVVEDFHLSDMQWEITPMVIFPEYTWLYCFSVKTTGDFKQSVDILQREWEKFFPEYPFRYYHTADLFKDIYNTELTTLRILFIFSLLSAIIAGTGLFALSSFFLHQRMHAAAIRKINGAKTRNIMFPELIQYFSLALISSLIALPVSWYTMNQWQKSFIYQSAIPFWLFPATTLMLILFSWMAVFYHTYRLTRINPSEHIRNR
jgi:putative ABC transport system permease protein